MAYKTTLGIESPEPSEPPAATGQLKKAFEQVDALLRKQLTTLVELAKLKVTEKLEAVALTVTGTLVLPGESITEAMLKKEVVTDAKVVTGRALVETGNAQGTGATLTNKTEYEPSTTRLAFVLLYNMETVAGSELKVTVDGLEYTLTNLGSGATQYLSTSFLLRPGGKFKVEGQASPGNRSYKLI